MATRKIETTISLDGEQAFKKALSAATREMRVMESELKAVSAAYDTNGDAAAFYTQKQQNLRNQISQQKQIIEALERAVRDAGSAYGENSKEVDGYAIKLNNARTRMARLEKELQSTDREVEELGRDAIRAGRQLEEGIGEGAEDAERKIKSLVSTMQQDISSIRTSSAVSAVTGLWDLATGAYNAVTGFVEGSVEYRRQLSFLVQNAENKGFDFETIKSQLISVQSLTGDASSAVEGLSNLLAADVDETRMEKAVNNLAGAVISFPETLKFESLADGLQETLATGSATGAFAEALERLGVDTEEFNKALEESPTAAGDLDIALSYLAAHGMEEVYKKWQETNGAMDDAAKTQAELEFELSRFGGTLEEYITTPIKKIAVDAMKYINDVVDLAEEKGAELAAEKVAEDMAAVGISGMEEQGRSQEEIDAAKKVLLGEAGNAETALLLKERSDEWGLAITEWFGNLLEPWKNEEQAQKNAGLETQTRLQQEAEAFEKATKGWEDFNEGTEDAAQVIERAAAALERDAKAQQIQPTQGEEITITGENGQEFSPIAVREDWNQVVEEVKQSAEQLQTAGQEAGAAVTTGFDNATTDWSTLFPSEVVIDVQNAKPAMEEAGEGLGEGVADGIGASTGTVGQASQTLAESAVDNVRGLSSAGFDAGAQYGESLAAGIRSTVSYVNSAASMLAAAAQINLGAARTYGPQPASSAINAVLNIDGKTFARVTAPYLSSQLTVTG